MRNAKRIPELLCRPWAVGFAVGILGAVIYLALMERGPGRSPRALDATRSGTGSAAEIRSPSVEPRGTARKTVPHKQHQDDDSNKPADLVVRVVDQEGSPMAGVPVKLLFGRDYGQTHEQVVARAVSTPPTGTALIPSEGYKQYFDGALAAQAQFRFALQVDLPFELPPRVELADRLDEEYELVLPPSGWLELHWDYTPRPHEGAPAIERVEWERVHFAGSAKAKRQQVDLSVSWATEPSPTTIGPLGLGWTLRLAVRDMRRAAPIGMLVVEGPTQAGQTKRATVSVTGSQSLRGHARNQSGEPLRERRLVVVLYRGEERRSGFVTTDAEGRFAIPIEYGYPVSELELTSFGGRGPKASARVEVPGRLGELFASVDVGTLILFNSEEDEGEVSIAKGYVRDESERPLARVLVRAWALLSNDEGEVLIASTRSRPDGSFALSAEVSHVGAMATRIRRMRLSTEARGYLDVQHEEPVVGDTDLQLVLRKAGEIRGRVLTDDWVPLDLVSIILLGSGMPNKRVLAEWVDGFAFETVQAGEVSLRVGVLGSDWILAARDGLKVVDGALTDAGMIDLRGKLSKLQLSVLGTDGVPLSDTELGLYDADGVGFSSIRTDGAGQLTVLVPSRATSLVLHVRGYHAAPVDLDTSLGIVVLKRDEHQSE